MDKFVGKRLDGRYEIKEIIGVGGMAVVYRAYDNVDDKIVAIKILKEEFTGNEEFLRRFQNESKAIAVLSHPNIVKVFDVSFGDLIQYIVMEHIDGITLKEYIEQNGPLSWNEAVYFTLQILRGLQHAHDKGVVHRDVKPQNIMVLPDNTIKVTDFGIARFARSEQRTITDKAIGSVHYISPEQARGENTDEKADVYSVGVMLYEMLTGKLPFQAESAVSVAIMQLQKDPQLPRTINGSIPIGLEQITMHAMQKESARRYKTAAEMLCDLEAFKQNPAISFDYDYFVDDSPTRFISSNSAKTEEVEEKEQKAPIIPILAGVSATFIVAIIILLCVLIPKFLGGTGDETECPNFVGMSYDEVENHKEYNDLYDIKIEWGDYNNDYDYGEIYRQVPDAGKGIKDGGTVTVYVSMGQKTVKVPDVYGFTSTRAKTQLEADGFKVKFVEMPDEDFEANTVIKTVPSRSTSVHEGTEVEVYVSTGAPTVYVSLPNLIGLKEEDAKKEIERYGLTVGEISYVASSKPKGNVIAQTPSVGSTEKVGKGSPVDIEISKGLTTFDLQVQLPTDFIQNFAKVSIWDGATCVEESNKIDIKNSGFKYTFDEFTVENVPATFTVKLSYSENNKDIYEPICDIKIIDEEGKWEQVKEYNYPTEADNVPAPTDESSMPATSETSSDTNE